MAKHAKEEPDMDEFLEQITSEAMLARLAELCEERPEVRVLYYMLYKPRILEWLHSVGVVHDGILGSLVPPFPPRDLRKITAEEDLEPFLWTGVVDLAQMIRLYEEHRRNPRPAHPAILDFGCGCGRMTRFLNGCGDAYRLYACDVNTALVQWCVDHLPGIETVQNDLLPPAPYPDAAFDLVYSLYIFTHLPRDRAALWLAEMGRILAPDGVLIVTTHGFPALEIIRESPLHQGLFRLSSDEVARIVERLEKERFVFVKYAQDALEMAQASEEYGNAFIHPKYFAKEWQHEILEVVQHLPGGLRSWQDIIILRRRSPGRSRRWPHLLSRLG
jgi:SAM-dependent methyltransferase